jgi:cytoskeleton protein RodZ
VPPKPDVKQAEAKPEPKPEAKPEPKTDAKTDVKADAKPLDNAKVKNEIILEALDKVDVKFQIHGETRRVSLGPTQVHTIMSDQPVILELSDGGAVNIILNGHERGVPGDLGKPKQIRIP